MELYELMRSMQYCKDRPGTIHRTISVRRTIPGRGLHHLDSDTIL